VPREQKGWSQTQLARQAGMTQAAVARFEAGGTVPTLPVLDRLAQALDAELVVAVNPRTRRLRRCHQSTAADPGDLAALRAAPVGRRH